jgi:hypothetical protein
MTDTRVDWAYKLGPLQCGNQLAYGLPGSEYCAKYKEHGAEWCKECCKDISENYPGTNVLWRRKEPFSMLTFFAPSGEIFVWPQRGQEGEEQYGHVFVFEHESYWAKQMARGILALREDWGRSPKSQWDDVVHVYESPFKELGDPFHGLAYSLDSLKEIASVYGKPVSEAARLDG